MQPEPPEKEQLLREALPIIRQTLQREFTTIPSDNSLPLLKATLLAYWRTLHSGQEKKLDLPAFARRLLREQAHVWLLRNGQAREQTASERWVLNKNEAGLRSYLRHFAFRTNDVIADIINQTFHDFFKNMRLEKPLITMLQAYLISLAKRKALNELRKERKFGNDGQRVYLQSLDQKFIDVDDAEFGSLRVPIPAESENEQNTTIYINDAPIVVPTKSLMQFLLECFEVLGQKRQEAVRLRFRLLSDADLASMSTDEVTEFITTKMSSAKIAQALGFASAQVVNSRTTENIGRLHACIQQKILNSESQ